MPFNHDRLAAALAAAPERAPAAGPRYRRGAGFFDVPRQRITRDERGRLIAQAEALEARTRQRGRVNGALGQPALRVLRALLFRFHGPQGCAPSYSAIQRATGLCRASVAAGLKRLERAGLLRIVRRLERRRISRQCPVTGVLQEFVATVQGVSAYLFAGIREGAEHEAPRATGRAAMPLPRSTLIARALGLGAVEVHAPEPGLQPSSRDSRNPRSTYSSELIRTLSGGFPQRR